MVPRVVFFAPPAVTPLDLVGPLQAFEAATNVGGHPYEIVVCGLTKSLPVSGNLHFSNLVPYRRIKLGPKDILIVAGFTGDPVRGLKFLRKHPALLDWIRRAHGAGATICSICSGSFLLAEAGILDGLACAAHWIDIEDMQRQYPRIEVRPGVLFVESGNVFTSAGIASGIDLAIHVLGLRHGPKLAFQVARYLVIYLRRSGDSEQESVYLKYRNHLDDTVHRAQTFLLEHLDRPPTLDRLAREVGSSARTLSRRFRQSLGLTVGQYQRSLRLERARTLLREDGSKVEDVARACGLTGPRQLRNLYHQQFGRSPRSRGRPVPAPA
jgi:transcriptional regulator GlxA family with amidase domain